MLLCIATILSLCMVYAVADNVCSEITGNGEPSSSVTFTVTTKSNWGSNDLSITQNKGKAWTNTMGSQYDAYGLYKVTYTNKDGKEKTKYFTDDKVKLDLKPNQTYTVTVKAYDRTSINEVRSYDTHYLFKGGFGSWKTAPTWKVSAQKNVELCQG